MTEPGCQTPQEVLPVTAGVGVVVVSYNSADRLPRMLESLRRSGAAVPLHVVVVDNQSDDRSADVARRHGVDCVEAGGNLGYAAAINLGRRQLPRGSHVLVLNPDLVVLPDAVQVLLSALADPVVGVAVPSILDEQGTRQTSLRREPTLLRALGDALLGTRLWPRRPGALAEVVSDPACYRAGVDADWATGAALLVSASCDATVGDWDETYFLYSEETDYLRRARAAGFRVRYVPDAVVVHAGGGSGVSAELAALMAVNRVRYFEKWHGARVSGVYRLLVALRCALRLHSPGHRLSLRYVVSRATWHRLPHAARASSLSPGSAG